jgi:hypothetical protein
MKHLENVMQGSEAPLQILLDAVKDTAVVRLQYGYDEGNFNLDKNAVLNAIGIGGLTERGGKFYWKQFDGSTLKSNKLLIGYETKDTKIVRITVTIDTGYKSLVLPEDKEFLAESYDRVGDLIRGSLKNTANKLQRLLYHFKKDDIPNEEAT